MSLLTDALHDGEDEVLPTLKDVGELDTIDSDQYVPLEFESPVELLEFFDKNIASGAIILHEWQKWVLNFLVTTPKTREVPLKLNIAAANGSGKDAYVNAVFAVYQILCRVRSRTIITSASKLQLSKQTIAYITTLVGSINRKLIEMGVAEKDVIKKTVHPIIQFTCSLTGSEIVAFTTDEPGRAEGWHPFPDYPNGELIFIVNEAKTVPDYIYEAFNRCKYCCIISISSPGQTSGKFYQDCCRAVRYPETFKEGEVYMRQVTSYDCSHIPKSRIEQEKNDWGENSFLFRSCHLAEFTTLNVEVCIKSTEYEKCMKSDVKKIDMGVGRHAGVDLAFGGGDAITIYVFDDNLYLGYDEFYSDDADHLFSELPKRFEKWKLTHKSIINIDDGNLGKLVISKLSNAGWSVNNICNQSAAYNKVKYLNRGAELYFNVADMIKSCLLAGLPTRDTNPKLFNQITNRYYDESGHQGRKALESKAKHRGRTGESPDHADGFVLAWAGWNVEDLQKGTKGAVVRGASVPSINQVAQLPQYTYRFDNMFSRQRRENRGSSFNPHNLLRGLYGGKRY